MIRSGVVGHLVLDHFEATGVGGVHQGPEFLEGAEVLLHTVKIHRAVTVVIRRGLARGRPAVVGGVLLEPVQVVRVVIPRRQPEGGDTEIAQV